jgi:hypothetical protein
VRYAQRFWTVSAAGAVTKKTPSVRHYGTTLTDIARAGGREPKPRLARGLLRKSTDSMRKDSTMKEKEVTNLVYEALETELAGVEVYETALTCAINDDLKKEWKEYLEQTRHHVEVVENLCRALSLDATKETPGRQIVRLKGEALVQAMKAALSVGDPAAAEIVAAECIVEAETKDHDNWELLGEVAKKAKGEMRRAIKQAFDEVEDEEDEHLYHTMGWARELRIQALGMPAVLPPPEEEKHVKSAIGAARAKQARSEML